MPAGAAVITAVSWAIGSAARNRNVTGSPGPNASSSSNPAAAPARTAEVSCPLSSPASWTSTPSLCCSDPCRSAAYIAPCSRPNSIGVADTRGTVPSPSGVKPG